MRVSLESEPGRNPRGRDNTSPVEANSILIRPLQLGLQKVTIETPLQLGAARPWRRNPGGNALAGLRQSHSDEIIDGFLFEP